MDSKEFNLAKDVEAFEEGKHPGYIPSAWDGLQQTLERANEKRIKIVINGGGLNPKGLAERTHALVSCRSSLGIAIYRALTKHSLGG